MPEAPDLEVVKNFLNERVAGASVVAATVLKPSVLRPIAGDLASDAVGRTIGQTVRQGKFLTISLSGDRLLIVNPMLTGAFQYCPPSERKFKRTCFVLGLSNGSELRYLDDHQMGRVYYVSAGQTGQIPQLSEQGPDVLDPTSFEEFRERLSRFRGEIKGVLARGRVVSGIGNAYADEILFAARIYPFRKSRELTEEEMRRLHAQSRGVVEEAVAVLTERMGDKTHVKIRDFLQVHNKGGTPCPRCGGNISQVSANQRITSYCRSCQPGLLLRT